MSLAMVASVSIQEYSNMASCDDNVFNDTDVVYNIASATSRGDGLGGIIVERLVC
jgi:hypothetical protein